MSFSFLRVLSIAAVIVSAPLFANAGSNQAVVKDARGNFVKSAVSGECVRTVWTAGADACAEVVATPKKMAEGDVSRSYLVFFDLDKADLSADTQNIINKSVSDAAKLGGGSYHVVGHTDTTGSALYNLRLSKKRAVAVQSDLARLGINVGDISIDAKGESELLVPTADGVLEPQNRRVEIHFTK